MTQWTFSSDLYRGEQRAATWDLNYPAQNSHKTFLNHFISMSAVFLLPCWDYKGRWLHASWRFCLSRIGRTCLITFITHHSAALLVLLPSLRSATTGSLSRYIHPTLIAPGDIIYHILHSEVGAWQEVEPDSPCLTYFDPRRSTFRESCTIHSPDEQFCLQTLISIHYYHYY